MGCILNLFQLMRKLDGVMLLENGCGSYCMKILQKLAKIPIYLNITFNTVLCLLNHKNNRYKHVH